MCFFLQNEADIQTQIKIQKENYNRKLLTCQPIVIAVGPTTKDLHDFYVIFDNIKYKFSSLLKAIDVCFKVYSVLNASYAQECEQLWTFLQKYFYKIHFKADKKFSRVSAFMTDLDTL